MEGDHQAAGIVTARDAGSPPTEATVAKIWADVFRKKHIGSDEKFSDIGGDSISAAVIITRIYESFGVEFQFADLFRAQTIRNLSERIDAAKAPSP